MPRNYKDDFDDEDLKALGDDIVEEWDNDNRDREVWLVGLPKWLRAYLGRPETKDLPWESASNLRVPVTPTAVDAIHPRIMAATWRPDPIVGFRPQDPSDEDLARKREKFLDWSLREEVNAFSVFDRGVLQTLLYGVQFYKISWDLRIRHLRDRHVFPNDMPLQEIVATVLKQDASFIEAVQRVEGEDKVEAAVKGRKVEFEVEYTPNSIVIYTERSEVVHDAPVLELVDAEDISVNSNCPFDIQQADHIYHRYYLTLDQVKQRVRQGTFDFTEKELEELELMEESSVDADDDETYNVKQEKEVITGADQTYREGDPERIEFIDAYQPYDINDDGYDEEIIATVVRKKPELVARVARLEDVYRHGMRPFGITSFAPADTTIWCIGIPQILENIQTEIDSMHNQRVDAGTISNTPWGWYEPSAGLNPEKIEIEPGVWLPCDDVEGVKEHQPANFTSWSEREEAILWAMVERRLKVNDLTLGRIGDTQGASRTATGVQALAAQQATGFDLVIRRVQEGWKGILQQILALYQQYMPPTKQVRILGKFNEPDMVVGRDDLTGKMDMIFTGNSLSTDREVERNTTTFLAQGGMGPAAQAFYLQLGIMTPQGIAEWLRHLLEVFDVPHIDRIITVPKVTAPTPAEEIVARVTRGERMTPIPGEDHRTVIELLGKLLNSPQSVGFPPESMMVMQEQLRIRQQAMIQEQIQMMMAQQAMMMQSQTGAPASAPGIGGAPPQLPSATNRLAF